MSDTKEVKGITFLPALTALIKPSTEYLGEEFKNAIKSKVDEHKKKKEEDNLIQHLKSVQEKTPIKDQENISYAQLDMFNDWVDGASKIDPKQSELSQVWQNLLIKAGEGEPTEIILNKLKTLSAGEALALMNFSKPSNIILSKEDLYHLDALEKNELIRPNHVFLTLMQTVLVVSVLVLIMIMLKTSFFNGVLGSFIQSKVDYWKFFAFITPIFTYIGAFILFISFLKKGGKWAKRIKQLTWIGESIVNLKN